MFEGFEEDDDLFLAPASSSNLASLFGQTMHNTSSANLTYTAPKQPISKEEPRAKSKIIIFKEVKTSKILDDTEIPLGNCGMVLIGNEVTNAFHILLYKHKNNIISTSKVNENFQFMVRDECYSSFTDDSKVNYLINFSSQTDKIEFVNLVQTHKGKIITSVRSKTQTKVKRTNVENKPLPTVRSLKKETESATPDSDNQSDSSENATRANILSRMAKMGQKLLPNKKPPNPSDSESESEQFNQKMTRKPKQNPGVRPEAKNSTEGVNVSSQHVVMNGQLYPVQSPIAQPVFMPLGLTNQSIMPIESSSSGLYTPPNLLNDQLNVFFAENRTHNSEVRMNIMRLTTKMEEMIDKVNKLEIKPEVKEMQTANIDHHLKETIKAQETTIGELKLKHSEYASEKTELEKNEKELNDRIKDLTQQIKELEQKIINHLEQIEYLQLDNAKKDLIIEENSVKTEKCEQINADVLNEIENKLKNSMSTMYNEIGFEFTEDNSFSGKEIKKILASKIKEHTYSIISFVKELNIPKNVNE